MGRVLCATRGGKASYRTQDAAIALAKERGDELAFLFVVDVGFLKRSRRAVRPEVVTAEMTRMGEFLLQMARERAESQGMDTGVLLRCGHLQEALKAAALEHRADLLVLGRPAGDESAYAFKELENLAADIGSETGIEVLIL
ncbi:MAG: universal stress protein [Anaerolineae bacterium]|jgi:nucleotide-binding universal stress UspA family protein|nr:universal stress protein [Anaerolineae bacterium]